MNRLTNTVMVLLSTVIPLNTTFSQVCEKTYVGNSGGVWQDGGNWDPPISPTSSDVACIPPDKVVYIVFNPSVYNPDAEAEAIVLQGEPGELDTGARLELESFTSLSLYKNSTVNGFLVLNEDTTLYIGDTLTITGDGGRIIGKPGSSDDVDVLIIDRPNQNRTLIIQGVDNTTRDHSLLLQGTFDVQVALSNRAYVIADVKDPLILSTRPKVKHTGYWVSENNPEANVGMIVNVEVRGGGTWQLLDQSSITINAPCPYLTGKVSIQNGKFEINENFSTTGQLILRSVNGSTPEVTVAQGKTASFSQ